MGAQHYTEPPPWERAARYRQMAAETEALARSGSPEFRASLLEFALRWRKLADELTSRDFDDLEPAAVPPHEAGNPQAPK
jgi:hypothetical protein